VFTGRPTPAPGEPLFTEEDTAGALALAEEERDTCPSCGYPKVWCRDPANQFGAFDVAQEFCWATYRLADYRKAKVENMSESQRASVQLAARFREGREPDFDAGLGLGDGDVDEVPVVADLAQFAGES
jgi:hypothetical protein